MTGFHSATSSPSLSRRRSPPTCSRLPACPRNDAVRDSRNRRRLGLHRVAASNVKRLVDTWVAVMLVRRERQAAIWASCSRLPGTAAGTCSAAQRRDRPDGGCDERSTRPSVLDGIFIAFTMVLARRSPGFPSSGCSISRARPRSRSRVLRLRQLRRARLIYAVAGSE